MEFAPREWYARHGIELHTGDPVEWIDRAAQRIGTRGGHVAHYHRLILTTGSRPILPRAEGTSLPGVFVYRTLDDLAAIQQPAKQQTSAVVLGGGLQGLEVAHALSRSGLQTTVVELAPSLLPRQLDAAGAALLREKIETLGIEFKLNHRTRRITRNDTGLTLHFEYHPPLAAGLVVIATGIRPRDELARRCGLPVGERGGIVVNDYLETSDRHILAAGECVLHRDQTYNLVESGYLMADVIADNLCGESRKFTGGDFAARLNLPGAEVSAVGRYQETGENIRTVVSPRSDAYGKLVLQENRLIGMVSVGANAELPRLQEAISQHRKLSNRQCQRFEAVGWVWSPAGSQNVRYWPPDSVVCNCLSLTRGELTACCRQGCTSVEGLARKTQASTICGCCRPLLAELVNSPPPQPKAGNRLLATLSLLALLLLVWCCWSPPVTSVAGSLWPQAAGCTLLGSWMVALGFSLRNRRIAVGSPSAWWPAIHAGLSLLTLPGLILPGLWPPGTVFHWLSFSAFLALNSVGAITALLNWLEPTTIGPLGALIHGWCPRLTRLHAWLFWPLPLLAALQVWQVYQAG